MAEVAGQSLGLEANGKDEDNPDDLAVDCDTPLTDALLDQFSLYYLVAALAVRALEEARRQRALAEVG